MQEGRIVALDYGRVRIGVAVSDALGISTKPLGFIPRRSDAQAARTVAALVRQERAVAVVIGLPLHAHGDAGKNVAQVRTFVAALEQHCSLSIYEVDERHSSQEAEEALRAEGRWPAPPGDVDAKAAAIILRRFLDGEQ